MPVKSYRNSLKFKLLLPYILLILLLTFLLGWLSWWAGSRNVADLSERLMGQITERIALAVDRHMYGTRAVLETAFPEQMRAPDDIEPVLDSLLTRLYTAASLYTTPMDYVYYGNELGQNVGLQKLVDGNSQVRLKLKANARRDFYLQYGISGSLDYRFTEQSVFDPRTRMWYQQGRDARQHTWTTVYLDYGSRELVVTRARKVLNERGDFAGVVASDLFLSSLGSFIRNLQTSENGRAFIVEPNGLLIAASSVNSIRDTPDGQTVRVRAGETGDNLIDAAWSNLQPILADDSFRPDTLQHLQLTDEQGNVLFVSLKNIRDEAGLNWYAMVVVPSEDILQGLRANLLWVTLIGLLAALLALLLGLLLFGRVARDVSLLSQAVKKTGQNIHDVSDQVRRNDEIGVLARSFSQMREELLTDRLTGVANRSALDYRLASLLDKNQTENTSFALLFIDLNKFKPLNDTYGHDKGDQALIETASRIQSILRGQDLVARLGGDEFVVLLHDTSKRENVKQLVQRMQLEISRPLDCCADVATDDAGVCLGAAIGMALYPEDGMTAEDLLKHADEAMYAAKAQPGADTDR